MRGTRGMFTRIAGNLLQDSGECYYFNIPGNIEQYSDKCSRRFRGMFEEVLGNVQEDSAGCSKRFWGTFKRIPCSRRFWGMFKRIPGNAQ